jgi:hypothetical protein
MTFLLEVQSMPRLARTMAIASGAAVAIASGRLLAEPPNGWSSETPWYCDNYTCTYFSGPGSPTSIVWQCWNYGGGFQSFLYVQEWCEAP